MTDNEIIRLQAIKDFAEKLTDKISVYSKYVDVDGIVILNRIFRMIEDIVKEMTEEGKVNYVKCEEALNILRYPASAEEDDWSQAIEVAKEALSKQIEIEKAQFTHICKSDNDYYPTTFSIYARIVDENDKSVTLDRFQKFGVLPLKSITISKEDFDRYYKPIKKSDKLGVM